MRTWRRNQAVRPPLIVGSKFGGLTLTKAGGPEIKTLLQP
jgi:hypothetical protein